MIIRVKGLPHYLPVPVSLDLQIPYWRPSELQLHASVSSLLVEQLQTFAWETKKIWNFIFLRNIGKMPETFFSLIACLYVEAFSNKMA